MIKKLLTLLFVEIISFSAICSHQHGDEITVECSLHVYVTDFHSNGEASFVLKDFELDDYELYCGRENGLDGDQIFPEKKVCIINFQQFDQESGEETFYLYLSNHASESNYYIGKITLTEGDGESVSRKFKNPLCVGIKGAKKDSE